MRKPRCFTNDSPTLKADMSLFASFFGRREDENRSPSSPLGLRKLHIEPLESREMLSVSPMDDEAIRAAYPDLNLAANMSQYNVIEITASQLSAETLQTAINTAANTTADDLILVRTHGSQPIDIGSSPLLIDIDSSRFGNLSIVSLGENRLQMRSDFGGGVLEVRSGIIALGGISLSGTPAYPGQEFTAMDLVSIADSAQVCTDQFFASVQTDYGPGNYDLASDVEGPVFASADLPLGSVPNSTTNLQSYSVTFSAGGTKMAFLTGLSLEEKTKIENGTITINTLSQLNPYDAEKYDVSRSYYGDIDHCWAKASANMLAYAGWGNVNGFQDEDDIADYFKNNFTDVGGSTFFGNEWYISGHYQPKVNGWQGWAMPKAGSTGGGLFPNVAYSSYSGTEGIAAPVSITSALEKLKEGTAVGLSVDWTNNLGVRQGGHAVTVWGMVYDTAYLSRSNQYYVSLLMTDSDDSNNDSAPRSRPNRLQNHAIAWNYTYARFAFTSYGKSGNNTGFLREFVYLKQCPVSSSMDIGDTMVAATSVTFAGSSYTITDQIGNGFFGKKDVDMFRIDVPAADSGKTYTFTTSLPTGGTAMDTYIRLFDSSGRQIAANDDLSTTFSRYSQISMNLSTGAYYLGVSGYDNTAYSPTSGGNGKDGSTGSYRLTVTRSGTATTKLTTPAIQYIGVTGSTAISIGWSSITNATGYTVQYSTNSNFSAGATWTKDVAQGLLANLTTSLTGLTAGTTYYVRVKAKGNGSTFSDSDYSLYLTAKTSAAPLSKLDTPTITSCHAISSSEINIAWDSVTGAAGYVLQLSTSSTFASQSTQTMDDLTGTGYRIWNLTAGTPYYFRVYAKGNGTTTSNSDYSQTRSATTFSLSTDIGDTLSTAEPISFSNNTFEMTEELGNGPHATKDVDMFRLNVGAADVGKTYTFTTSLPIAGTAVDTYIRLFNSSGSQIDSNDDIDYPVNRYSSLSFVPTAAGTYYLGVSSFSNREYSPTTTGSGPGGETGDYTLTVTQTAAPLLKLTTPAITSVSSTGTSTIRIAWDAMDNAAGYTVQYSTDGTFAPGSVRSVDYAAGVLSGSLPELEPDTTYHVRVRARGNGTTHTDSDFSTSRSAKTEADIRTITVSNTNDDGAGSLRQAVRDSRDGGLVVFSSALAGRTIVLSEVINIDKSITIDGGTTNITVSGGNRTNIFSLDTGDIEVSLKNFKITAGSTPYFGGAIDLSLGSLSLDQMVVTDCEAAWGGAIYQFGGSLHVTNTTFSGNRVPDDRDGGAIGQKDGTAVFINCTITENFADWGGGIRQSGGEMRIVNCTILENDANLGGGILQYPNEKGFLYLYNSIVAKNTATQYDPDIHAGIGLLTGNNNLVGIWDNQSKLSASDGNKVGTTENSLDPGLGTKGTTDRGQQYYALLPGSPAINAGKNLFVPSEITTDQIGRDRIQGGAVDIGAYEYAGTHSTQLSPPTLDTLTAVSSTMISVQWSAVLQSNGYTLQYAIDEAFTDGLQSVPIAPGITTANLSGLGAGTKYYVRVKALGNGTTFTDSEYSDSGNVRTPTVSTDSITVTNTNDGGAGSLRQAMQDIPDGGNIVFASSLGGKTITLSSYIRISKGVYSIDGTAASNITISGGNSTYLFYISGEETSLSLNNLKLIDCDGSVGGSIGGAIYASSGELNMTRVAVSNCTADYGGAVYSGGRLNISHCSFTNNTAASGGAIYLSSENPDDSVISNTLIADNSATDHGGGILLSKGHLKIYNSTITENTADEEGGGGIYQYAIYEETSMEIHNTILASNSEDIRVHSDADFSGSYNLIGIWDDPVNLSTSDGNLIGTTAAPISPGFGPKATTSQGIVYRPLLSGSRAINAGNNSFLGGASVDLAGNTRLIGGVVDIGACEFSGSAVQVPTAIILGADSLVVQKNCWFPVSGSGIDPLGRGLTYLWDFTGDGVFTEYANGSAWFSTSLLNDRPGPFHTIRLKVCDMEGNTSAPVDARITILDTAPTFSVDGPKTGELAAGRPGYWEFSSHDSSFAPIMKWSVNWGDGTETEILGGPRNRITDSHVYRAARDYVITVSTTDIDGVVSTFTLSAAVKRNTFPVQAATERETVAVSAENLVDPASNPESPEIVALSRIDEETRFEKHDPKPAPADSMRLRQMLDLDQGRTQIREPGWNHFSEQVWEEDDWFEYDGFGSSDEQEEAEFWSEILEDNWER